MTLVNYIVVLLCCAHLVFSVGVQPANPQTTSTFVDYTTLSTIDPTHTPMMTPFNCYTCQNGISHMVGRVHVGAWSLNCTCAAFAEHIQYTN
jgi:hypothetical protein